MKKYIFPLVICFLSCGTDDEIDEPINGEEEFSSELFISEYVEGTSFNKAIEIVNLTGETIDLEVEGYSVKKQSNGAGNWIGEVFLTGSLAHRDVFVIANGSSDNPTINNQANQLKSGAPMDFNGNDPVGLFKEGVLIDIIGNFDDPQDFAKDVTLRKNLEITEPSTTYNQEEWENFAVDDVEDLGQY